MDVGCLPAGGGGQVVDNLEFLTRGQFLVYGWMVGTQLRDATDFPGCQLPVAGRGLVADVLGRLGHGRPAIELVDERQAILMPWIGRRLDVWLEVLGRDIVLLGHLGGWCSRSALSPRASRR